MLGPVRFLAILLIFLLPWLGVVAGLGFTILLALLVALPLFAFEFGTESEPSDREVPPPRKDTKVLSQDSRDASRQRTPVAVENRRRRVGSRHSLRHHE